MEQTIFNVDPYPGKPKILFIGHGSSSHTLAWIDSLKDEEFNVRLFCLPDTVPPQDWWAKAYVISPAEKLPFGLDSAKWSFFYTTPEQRQKALEEINQDKDLKLNAMRRNLLYWLAVAFKKIYNWRGVPQLSIDLKWPIYSQLPQPKAPTSLEWLADVILEWKPDIIHTLGLDSAGKFYFQALRKFKLEKTGKWVLQLRGGSDLTLSRHDLELVPEIKEILGTADEIISDNLVNFEYLREMGIDNKKFASISPVPGTGGIDVQSLAKNWQKKTSQRRIILWPKAYDCEWSVALPVFEALKMVWDRIQPCEIYMFVMVTPGTRMWYNALPEEIRRHCVVANRIPRDEILDLMTRTRVMLAPSLVDGVPNSLYEAMAAGAFPIVSPLETIVPIVKDWQNTLFARNLYPQEIADALLRAMTDDTLVDQASRRNLEMVMRLADRAILTPRIIKYYESLVE